MFEPGNGSGVCKATHDQRRVIRGSIIHHHHLLDAVALVQGALNREPNKVRSIMGRDDDSDPTPRLNLDLTGWWFHQAMGRV